MRSRERRNRNCKVRKRWKSSRTHWSR